MSLKSFPAPFAAATAPVFAGSFVAGAEPFDRGVRQVVVCLPTLFHIVLRCF
jgi:hypothetical protein